MPLNQVCPTGASLRRMSLFVDSMNHGVPFRIDYLKLCEFAERWFSATCVARRFYSPVPRRADGQRRWAGAVRGGYEIVETPSNSDGDIVVRPGQPPRILRSPASCQRGQWLR